MPQYVPLVLRQAFENGQWPRGRLNGSRFPAVWSRFHCDLELTPALADIEAGTSGIADIGSLPRHFNGSAWHFYQSSLAQPRQPFPWIDLSMATCIGGGADYGDDLLLLLDWRIESEDPPVVWNLLSGDTPWGRADWILAAPSLTEFLRQARG